MTLWLNDTFKRISFTAFFAVYIMLPNHGFSQSGRFNSVPVKGMPTMIDLGAASCVPCKMMAPILEKLEKQYRGKAAIVFFDVRKDPQAAGRFGIRAIPTQIFFDKNRNEVGRHEGFLPEAEIVQVLEGLLAETAQADIQQKLPEAPMPVLSHESSGQSSWYNSIPRFYLIWLLIIMLASIGWVILKIVGKPHRD